MEKKEGGRGFLLFERRSASFYFRTCISYTIPLPTSLPTSLVFVEESESSSRESSSTDLAVTQQATESLTLRTSLQEPCLTARENRTEERLL